VQPKNRNDSKLCRTTHGGQGKTIVTVTCIDVYGHTSLALLH